MRRTGLAPGTEDERDPTQVRMAIESIRVLMPMVEEAAPQQAAAIRDALSQLQLAYVRIGGQPGGDEAAGASEAAGSSGTARTSGPGGSSGAGGSSGSGGGQGPAPSGQPKRDDPGPAQRSGRLWVPGQ
jgi:uncharacterized membrane protein YgcG